MEVEQKKCAIATFDELRDCAYFFLLEKLVTKEQFSSIIDFLNEKESQSKIAYQTPTKWKKVDK